ncbi:MAG: primosomal protein N' (replication factor Y), partial [Ilumatobacter sp.]
MPNVTGLDKSFDYLIPDDLRAPARFGPVRIGTIVRVELHGRRIGGWISDIVDFDDAAVDRKSLKPISKITGHGPDVELFELAEWASIRWAARRSRPFLVAASPSRAITSLPPARRTAPVVSPSSPSSPATTELLAAGGGVLRLPPRSDVLPALRSAIAHGPT